eukprot:3874964-Amphidinium_carterae.1
MSARLEILPTQSSGAGLLGQTQRPDRHTLLHKILPRCIAAGINTVYYNDHTIDSAFKRVGDFCSVLLEPIRVSGTFFKHAAPRQVGSQPFVQTSWFGSCARTWGWALCLAVHQPLARTSPEHMARLGDTGWNASLMSLLVTP